MAHKQKKKQSQGAKPQKVSSESPSGNKLKPMVRTMLLSDLVFLAAVQWLCELDMIVSTAADLATIGGTLVLIVALYLQFCTPKGRNNLEKHTVGKG